MFLHGGIFYIFNCIYFFCIYKQRDFKLDVDWLNIRYISEIGSIQLLELFIGKLLKFCCNCLSAK